MSFHTHTQHLTVLALTMKQIRSVPSLEMQAVWKASCFVFLVLIQEYEPAAKASVMGCIFRKWSW